MRMESRWLEGLGLASYKGEGVNTHHIAVRMGKVVSLSMMEEIDGGKAASFLRKEFPGRLGEAYTKMVKGEGMDRSTMV